MRDRLMAQALRRALTPLVQRGRLRIHLPSGQTLLLGDQGDQGQPQVSIRLCDRWAVWALLRDPDFQLGELFMHGRLCVEEGAVFDLLELLLRDAKAVPLHWTQRWLDRWRMALRPLRMRNQSRQARANVAHHYDLDDRLYRLFLDPERQYSCAYFENGDEDLETAQRAKQRHITAKLRLQPGQRVLDIGCGWGGLSRYLAEVGGAGQVTGITLSQEQLAGAQWLGAASPCAAQLSYRLEDYRATPGRFERIVSVGMFEHVGRGFHDVFFRKCFDLLSDDGVMLLHFIGNSDVPDFNNPWLEKYIFPGGHLPSLSECLPAIERSGLIVTDIEVLRLHYARTLRLWRTRFMARRDEARALYDERFCKMWEFYLAMSEAAFLHQDIAVFQIQLARRQDSVPLTRNYMEADKAVLQARERAGARGEGP